MIEREGPKSWMVVTLLAGLLFLGTSTPTSATLGSLSLSNLIGSSQLILLGRVVRSEVSPEGAGIAQIQIKEIYKGAVGDKKLVIKWTNDVERQAVRCIDSQWVFFLRKGALNTFEEAEDGRSYWPLQRDDATGVLVAPYEGLLSAIKIDVPEVLTEGTLAIPETIENGRWLTRKVQVVPLDRLREAIAKITGRASSRGTVR